MKVGLTRRLRTLVPARIRCTVLDAVPNNGSLSADYRCALGCAHRIMPTASSRTSRVTVVRGILRPC